MCSVFDLKLTGAFMCSRVPMISGARTLKGCYARAYLCGFVSSFPRYQVTELWSDKKNHGQDAAGGSGVQVLGGVKLVEVGRCCSPANPELVLRWRT